MANYIYTNDGLVNADELAHYGVPGMRWGHRKAMRLEKRTTRRFAKAGRTQGMSDYYRDKAAEIRRKHDSMAAALDKKAKQYDKQGGAVKAEVTRRAAEALRKRGMNASASDAASAARYAKKTEKLLAKANKYADKKHVDLGKNKINSIIKESKKKGYDREKNLNEWQKEMELEEKLGSDNYATYNKIRGRG
jgi:hypothetical protein